VVHFPAFTDFFSIVFMADCFRMMKNNLLL
jgi:hypothetical protein